MGLAFLKQQKDRMNVGFYHLFQLTLYILISLKDIVLGKNEEVC